MLTFFFKKYYSEFILGLLLLAVVSFSLPNLTTKPRLWYDEGVNIEFAKNLVNFGKLDIQTAPGIFSGMSYLFQATGYAVTMPLAVFFKIFGIGPIQARLYMLLWMIIFLITLFLFTKKLFGPKEAIIISFLIASFASFHDNGRAVMGEIPGFVFLLWALYFFLWQRSYFISGLFFGLAIFTKISVYISVIPALIPLLLLEKRNFWRNGLKILFGIFPSFLLRTIFIMPNPFSLVTWHQVFDIFKNPFGNSISPLLFFITNIAAIPRTYTLLYFGLFALVILFTYLRYKENNFIHKQFFVFAIAYCFFAFLYYLKSPGWLRYFVAAEFFIFILLVPALKNIFKEKAAFFYMIILGLVFFQTFYLFNYAKIFYSDSEEKVISLINTEFGDRTIGIFDIPEIGAFIDSARKFQIYRMMGVPSIGNNPVLYDLPPEIFIIRANNDEGINKMSFEERDIFSEKYQFLRTVDRYNIYVKIKLI